MGAGTSGGTATGNVMGAGTSGGTATGNGLGASTCTFNPGIGDGPLEFPTKFITWKLNSGT